MYRLGITLGHMVSNQKWWWTRTRNSTLAQLVAADKFFLSCTKIYNKKMLSMKITMTRHHAIWCPHQAKSNPSNMKWWKQIFTIQKIIKLQSSWWVTKAMKILTCLGQVSNKENCNRVEPTERAVLHQWKKTWASHILLSMERNAKYRPSMLALIIILARNSFRQCPCLYK